MNDELFGSVETAIHDTVNGYVDGVTKGRGAVALAPMLGMQPGTLSNKANPQQDHQLTLRESIPLQLVSRDFRILHAYASTLHHVAYPLPAESSAGDVELLDQYADMHAELGTMAQAVRESLRDARIRSDEVQRIREAFDATARAGLCLIARLEALVDDRR